MAANRTPDPASANRFVFSVSGRTIGSFTEVSGLGVEVTVEEVTEGGQNEFVHKLPGPKTWPNIVLKAGVTNADDLFAWLSESAGDGFGGTLERATGHIGVCDAAGTEVRGWDFIGAFAVRWSGPTLSATASDLAVEELEIAHHGFTSSSG